MPFYHFDDEDAYDEDIDLDDHPPTPVGAFEFEEIEARFNAIVLTGMGKVMFDLLKIAGINEMRVLYDGGHDEGFAHADDVWINGRIHSVYQLVDILNAPSNIDAILKAADTKGASNWGDAGAFYREQKPQEAIQRALDELADAIATQMLGDGYGTGEYELYGAATINFETGAIMDDPNAQRRTDSF